MPVEIVEELDNVRVDVKDGVPDTTLKLGVRPTIDGETLSPVGSLVPVSTVTVMVNVVVSP